ncbi:hypothetical protein GCM10010211_56610 [Streptomyces albospinus]|uniref:Uncharacterized protein n=1 Tax=Streptomyces albospinus TaxID=285515 RepID=A0ABQ2VES2_9ACTN|nr:hypothetical protein [Streptomyces albospinus]GGU83300.1 hypothetical protein GCM10010211_56610 [Streptomyces albospinus]
MGVNEAGYGAGYGGGEAVARPSGGGGSDAVRGVRIDIGELVLDGFPSGVDAGRVSAAFQRELARLVRERGVPLAADGAGVAVDGLAGLPQLPATASAVRIGQALARAVHAGLAGRGEVR